MQDIFKNNVEYHAKNGIEYIQFKKLLEYPEITHCYTLRSDNKISFPPIYKDEKMLKQSYEKICDCLNLNVATVMKPHQTHTDRVEIIEKIEYLDEVDGMITDKENIALLTTSADCTSLLFFDPVKKVIADVHSGWKGTLKAIGKKTVEKMIKHYNCNPQDIICCICPCIKACCFEVDEDVKDLFQEQYKNLSNIIIKANVVDGKQKYHIDTTKINIELLKDIGLKDENIIDSDVCTRCNSKYFHSYRVDKEKSGRNASIISINGG